MTRRHFFSLIAGLPLVGKVFQQASKKPTDLSVYADRIKGSLPGAYSMHNIGHYEPSAEYRSFPWLKIGTSGLPECWLNWNGKEWVRV